MKRVRRWLLVILVAASGTACEYPTTTNLCDPIATADGGRVLTITETWTEPFDALPGDRLNVLMVADGGQVERCQDMGGEMIHDPRRMTWTCEEVDF